MLFLLDDKIHKCKGFYVDGNLLFKQEPAAEALSHTWDYHGYFKGKAVEYARIYCHGKTLDEVCPKHLEEEYRQLKAKFKAFLKSFKEAKVNLEDNCLFDLLPLQFLRQFYDCRSKICQHVFETYERPANHDFLVQVWEMLDDISQRKICVDKSAIANRMCEAKVRNFAKQLLKQNSHVCYDIFGAVTGRLTTKKGSFPAMTLAKEFRSVVKSCNGLFLEIDYNACEARVLLGLQEQQQIEEDIHQWNADNLFGGISREEAKKRFFSFLYDPTKQDREIEKYYDRKVLLDKFWDGNSKIKTVYGREIEAVDEYHALNYCVQSTASDMFLEQSLKINDMLKDKKSSIAFLNHDSITIDVAKQDKDMIQEMIEAFRDTKFGKFRVKASLGKNLGEMQEL